MHESEHSEERVATRVYSLLMTQPSVSAPLCGQDATLAQDMASVRCAYDAFRDQVRIPILVRIHWVRLSGYVLDEIDNRFAQGLTEWEVGPLETLARDVDPIRWATYYAATREAILATLPERLRTLATELGVEVAMVESQRQPVIFTWAN